MNAPTLGIRIKRRLRRWFPLRRRLSDPDPRRIEAIERDGITVRCQRQWPAEDLFLAAWERLHSSSPSRTTFNSPLWQQKGLGPTIPADSLRLITVWDSVELLAVLPLHLSPQGFLETPGRAMSDYLDPLVQTAQEHRIWPAILRFLQAQWDPSLRALTLRNLRADSPVRAILQSLAPAFGFSCVQTLAAQALRIHLPDTWNAYLETLESHHRKEVRRKLNKAQTQAHARLITYARQEADDSLLSPMLDMIESNDAFKHEWFSLNVRPMLQRIGPELLHQGLLRLHVLLLDARPGACLIEFPSPQGPMLYNTGFASAQRHWSPGVVAFALAIQQAIRDRATLFDLLRGQDPYKQHLGALPSPLYHLTLSR